ncbi:MAG: hypothetical protein JWL59_1120 [Chthoniobacteraceae bacterium]|nr:hypothetical protein [Chthoniobacteraceae bacterium]
MRLCPFAGVGRTGVTPDDHLPEMRTAFEVSEGLLRALEIEDAVDHRFDAGHGNRLGDVLQSFAAPHRDVTERRPAPE